jgi:hypothetical protein
MKDEQEVIKEMTKTIQEQAQTNQQLLSLIREQSRTIADLSVAVRSSAEMAVLSARHKLSQETLSQVQQKVVDVETVVRRLTEGEQNIMGEDAEEA